MQQPPLPPREDEPFQVAPTDDPRLAAATARARNRLPEFIQLLRERPTGVRFFVKAAFRRFDGRGLKHMWVLVSVLDGDALVGTLESDSEGKTRESRGDAVRIPTAEIEDWLYDRGGKKYTGGFSIPVLDGIERENLKREM